MLNKHQDILIIIAALFLVLGGMALAGTITAPVGTPNQSAYTLEDIYNKLTVPDYNQVIHDLGPGSLSPGTNSMHSLDSIFSAIPAHQVINGSSTIQVAGIYATTTLADKDSSLAEGNIKTGVTIFGKTGSFDCVAPAP